MKIQIDDEIIELTAAEEKAYLAKLKSEYAEVKAEEEAQLAIKKSAQAKLAALGLTDDEVAAIVGN